MAQTPTVAPARANQPEATMSRQQARRVCHLVAQDATIEGQVRPTRAKRRAQAKLLAKAMFDQVRKEAQHAAR